jgi:hypothetical protein
VTSRETCPTCQALTTTRAALSAAQQGQRVTYPLAALRQLEPDERRTVSRAIERRQIDQIRAESDAALDATERGLREDE